MCIRDRWTTGSGDGCGGVRATVAALVATTWTMSVWRSVAHLLLTGPCGSGSDEHHSTASPRLVTGARGPEESDRLDRATQPLSTFLSRVGQVPCSYEDPAHHSPLLHRGSWLCPAEPRSRAQGIPSDREGAEEPSADRSCRVEAHPLHPRPARIPAPAGPTSRSGLAGRAATAPVAAGRGTAPRRLVR